MKGLARKLLMGAGLLAIGAGTPQKNVAWSLYEGEPKITNYSKISEPGKSLAYSEAEMALKEYQSYELKFNEGFLESAKSIDSRWGHKYKAKIKEDLWLKETSGIIDRNLAYSTGIKESSANPRAKQSESGARGFWQIMEETWRGFTPLPFDKAFEFNYNEQIAIINFKSSINYLEKNLPYWKILSLEEKQKLVLAAHNWGQGNVVRVKGNLHKAPYQTRDLVEKVFTYYKYLNHKDEFETYLKERNENFSSVKDLLKIEPKAIYSIKPN